MNSVDSSFWKRLWTSCKADCRMMIRPEHSVLSSCLTGTDTQAVEGTTGSQGLTEEGPLRVTVGVRLIRLLSLRCLATDSCRGLLRGSALTLTRNMITGGEGILTRPKLKCTLHVVQYVS